MMGRWFIGLILIAIGLSSLFEINLFKFVFPVLMIWLGWMIISKDKNSHRTSDEREIASDSLNEVYIFSGTRKKIKSTDFNGGKAVAVFGGIELDLSETKTKSKSITMEMEAIFGGVRVRIPKNWEVDSVGMSAVMGGFDNRTDTEEKKDVKLLVSGAAVFGGIEIYSA